MMNIAAMMVFVAKSDTCKKQSMNITTIEQDRESDVCTARAFMEAQERRVIEGQRDPYIGRLIEHSMEE